MALWCLLAARGLANGRLGCPEEAIDVWPWGEAIDVWPWGACWLQEGWQTADLDAHKKPLMCGLGVAVGCRMKHAKSTF